MTSSALGTAAWKDLRAAYRAAHPLCELCLLDGLTVAMAAVDHIIPRAKGGAVYEWANLQSLCLDCHRLKTQWEQGNGVVVDVAHDGTVVEYGWEPPEGMREGVVEGES